MWIITNDGATNTDHLTDIVLGHEPTRVVGVRPDESEFTLAPAKDFDKIMQALKNGDNSVYVSF